MSLDVDLTFDSVGLAVPSGDFSSVTATSGFQVFGESTTSPGLAHVTALPRGGYLFTRTGGSMGTVYYGTHNDPVTDYEVDGETFTGHTEHTRRYTHEITDASLADSTVLYSFTNDGAAYLVFGSDKDTDPDQRDATVLVFRPNEWTSPGKFTVEVPVHPEDLTWHFEERHEILKFIETPGRMSDNDTVLSAWVGQTELPATVKRYRLVNGNLVYSPYDDDVVAPSVYEAHSVDLNAGWYSMNEELVHGELPWFTSHPTYTVTLVDHRIDPYWHHEDPDWVANIVQPQNGAYEWVHYVRRVLTYEGTSNTYAFVVAARFSYEGADEGMHQCSPYLNSYGTASRMQLHDPAQYHPIDGNLYVKFEATGWRIGYYDFWSSASRNNSPRFYTVDSDIGDSGLIPYPATPTEVLLPIPVEPHPYVGRDAFAQAVVGPVAMLGEDEWGLQDLTLFVLYLIPYLEGSADNTPGMSIYSYYPVTGRKKLQFDLDEDVYHDVFRYTGVTGYSSVVSLQRPIPGPDAKATDPGSFTAAISFDVEKPHSVAESDSLLSVVSSGVWPGFWDSLDADDVWLDSSDTVADLDDVTLESEGNDFITVTPTPSSVVADGTILVQVVDDNPECTVWLSCSNMVVDAEIGHFFGIIETPIDIDPVESDGVADGEQSRDYTVDGPTDVDLPLSDPLTQDLVIVVGSWYEYEDLSALVFDTSGDGGVNLINFAANYDLTLEGDQTPDGEVRLFGDYENEDVPLLQELQVTAFGWYTLLSDYENEDMSLTGDLSADATAMVEDGAPTTDLVLDAGVTDLSGVVLVYSQGITVVGDPPTPGTCTSGECTVTLPEGANPAVPLTYLADGHLVSVLYEGTVLDVFYVEDTDLSTFCVTVLSSTGTPVTGLPDAEVDTVTPTYTVDTSMQTTDVFMVGEGDHVGVVYYGPSVFITSDNEVEVMWDFASPDDFEGKRVVWLFGYDNPPLSFEDAALIAASGNGRYLRLSLPSL